MSRTYKDATELSLLSSFNRVATPFIRIQIGNFVFGVVDKLGKNDSNLNIAFNKNGVAYPNYVKQLTVQKINGQVNQYTLNLDYPITGPGGENEDPNFIEKVLSSVSKTRKIVFSYGDLSAPAFCYRDEEAIINEVTKNFNISGSVISYTISAVSSGNLLNFGYFNFEQRTAKPSDVIKELLKQNSTYGIIDVFPGMKDWDKVNTQLIPGDDQVVTIPAKNNISVLDYLSFLVSNMIPLSAGSGSLQVGTLYSMVIHDDTSGTFEGTYFEIKKTTQTADDVGTFTLDIGYPSDGIVTQFSIDNNEAYSILYEYSGEITHNNEYTYKLDDNGKLIKSFSPIVSSNNPQHTTRATDKTWWTKVTQYPITAQVTLKGLLRPAILMTHVRLNVLFFGRKSIDSGLYLVTKQIDTISEGGYQSQLTLLRISGDDGTWGVK